MRRHLPVLLLLTALAACAAPKPPQAPREGRPPEDTGAGFSRQRAIQTALREWRLFGSPIHDEAPGSHLPLEADEMPSRQDGLWQRDGDYWWVSQKPGSRASLWTGKTDANGDEFPAEDADRYAWSAAFISYVMRVAGAGNRFPYAPSHATYINAALTEGTRGEANLLAHDWAIVAHRPEEYAPQSGDLICTGRDQAAGIRFDDLPARFPAHCDIVVGDEPGRLTVIGGNVAAAVSMKHVPVTKSGRLVDANGVVLDDRYPWFVVLQVLYD